MNKNYDHIKVGDLIFLKRKINLCKDKSDDVCIVLHKQKTNNEFFFKILYKGKIKTYNTTHFHRNTMLELVNNV